MWYIVLCYENCLSENHNACIHSDYSFVDRKSTHVFMELVPDLFRIIPRLFIPQQNIIKALKRTEADDMKYPVLQPA